jgi:hypothetical protein
MNSSVAFRAEGDQIFLRIGPGLTSELPMVNLKVGHRAARLASPTVSPQDLIAKLVVQLGSQANRWLFWSEAAHDAFSVV